MTATCPQTLETLKLTPFELDALVLLGVLFAPQSPNDWALWLNDCRKPVGREARATHESMAALGERLLKRGLVQELASSRKSYTLGGDVATVLSIAHEHGRLLPISDEIQTILANPRRTVDHRDHRLHYYFEVAQAYLVGKLRVSLTVGDSESIGPLLAEIEARSGYGDEFPGLLSRALGTNPPEDWLDQLPEVALAVYLGDQLENSKLVLSPLPAAVSRRVSQLATHKRKRNRNLRLTLARLLVLQGESAAAVEQELGLSNKGELAILELLELFTAGDHRGAADRGDAIVAAMKPRKYKQLGNIEGVIHALARIVSMEANPDRIAALRQSLDDSAAARSAHPQIYEILHSFEQTTRSGRVPTRPPRGIVIGRGEPAWWLAVLASCLCIHWLGLDLREHAEPLGPHLEFWRTRAEAHGYPGIAREFAALLAIYDQRSPPAQSLAAAYQRREPWQMILETLESSVKRIEVDSTAADDGFREHVMWEVELLESYVHVAPRLVSSARSRKGKVMTASTLLGNKSSCLSDADRRVLATAQGSDGGWRGYSGNRTFDFGWEALVALIDHPRVRNSSGEPLRISRGQGTIRSRIQSGTTILELDPPELAHRVITYKQLAPHHIAVFEQDPTLAPVYALFARAGELQIPNRGRERLLDSLAGLATVTELRIEGESSLSSKTVEADSTLVLQLQWDGSSFVTTAQVAPLGLAGPHFKPGDGPTKIVARVEQAMLSCTRDLDEERRRFEAMLDACPGLASQPEDDGRFTVNELDTALELLLEFRALGDTLRLTWPRGRKLSVPRELGSRDLRIAVQSKRDWLQVDVELDAEEGLILGFKQLLEGRRGSGRFIALAEDRFLALTSELRRRIDSLESLGTVKKAKLEVHPITLPLIEQIALDGTGGPDGADPTAFKADKKARVRLADLQGIAAKTARIPRGLQANLRDYQVEGFQWMARLAEAGLGAVLADDMGLGKTIQALALLCHRSKRGPALVVAPTSVVSNWLSEAERFAPRLRCHVLANADDRASLLGSLRAGDVLVCSYGLLVSEARGLGDLQLATVIFDEAHALKNSRSQRAKAAFSLTSEFRLSLTGTPIENHLGELWSVFQATVPGLLASEKRFEERFSRPISHGQRERARQLRAMVRPFMLRRTKAQVLDELPPRTEVTIKVTPGPAEKAFYEALRRDALEQTVALEGKGGKSRLRILAEITRLRQAAIDPRLIDAENGPPGAKIDALIRRLVDLRDEGHRALVFTQFLGSMATIHERLEQEGIRYLSFDGSTPAKQRTKVVEAFQAGEADVFVMSLKAGGVGINLTEADYVIHLDPWWNPAVEDQATGRAHRIGQQRPVTVYRLVTAGTIEEQILELHGSKRDLADDLLAGLDSAKKLDFDELRALLRGS